MISALVTGITFGLSAGVAPGPLLTLVITQTLRHNTKEGALVGLAPLVTDIPIVLVSVLLVRQIAHQDILLGSIGIAGAVYVLYLAYETTRAGAVAVEASEAQPHSIRKGALINALNPHPYLFWATVGAPFALRAYENGAAAPCIFIASFYVSLVGAKLSIAVLCGRFRPFLEGRAYVNMMRGLGVVLAGFAIFLAWDALILFGALPNH